MKPVKSTILKSVMFSHFVPISFDGFPGGAIGPARALRASDGNGQRGRACEGTNHFGEAPEGGGNLAVRSWLWDEDPGISGGKIHEPIYAPTF